MMPTMEKITLAVLTGATVLVVSTVLDLVARSPAAQGAALIW